MAYRYRSRRSARKLARKDRRNFILTLFLVGILIYATFAWILPSLIGGIGFINSKIKPPQKVVTLENNTLAPPVLTIPYEATNSAQIDISGYSTPYSKVKLYLDDEVKQTIDVSGDGSFIFKNVFLKIGTNNIYGKTLDDKGNDSLSSKSIKLFYNNEKPNLTLNEPEDNKKIQGGDKKVKVYGRTDPGVKVFINGNQVIVDRDGNFSAEQTLNDGDNIISVKAIDLASNTTEVERRVIYTP